MGLFSPRKGCCFPEGQRGPSKAATAFPPANVGPVGRGPRDGSGLGFARKAKNEGQRRRRGMTASCDSEIVQRFGLFAVFVKLVTDEKLRGWKKTQGTKAILRLIEDEKRAHASGAFLQAFANR